MSASSSPTHFSAPKRDCSDVVQSDFERCSTDEPNLDSENLSPVLNFLTMAINARRAACMLPPAIEPEQSTKILTAVCCALTLGMLGLKLAVAT